MASLKALMVPVDRAHHAGHWALQHQPPAALALNEAEPNQIQICAGDTETATQPKIVSPTCNLKPS